MGEWDGEIETDPVRDVLVSLVATLRKNKYMCWYVYFFLVKIHICNGCWNLRRN